MGRDGRGAQRESTERAGAIARAQGLRRIAPPKPRSLQETREAWTSSLGPGPAPSYQGSTRTATVHVCGWTCAGGWADERTLSTSGTSARCPTRLRPRSASALSAPKACPVTALRACPQSRSRTCEDSTSRTVGARSVCFSPCGVRSHSTDLAAGKRRPTAALLRSDAGGAERIGAAGAVAVIYDGSVGGGSSFGGGACGKKEETTIAVAATRVLRFAAGGWGGQTRDTPAVSRLTLSTTAGY